jgi:hypothetical protein
MLDLSHREKAIGAPIFLLPLGEGDWSVDLPPPSPSGRGLG